MPLMMMMMMMSLPWLISSATDVAHNPLQRMSAKCHFRSSIFAFSLHVLHFLHDREASVCATDVSAPLIATCSVITRMSTSKQSI